jgi:hypothetical protein
MIGFVAAMNADLLVGAALACAATASALASTAAYLAMRGATPAR